MFLLLFPFNGWVGNTTVLRNGSEEPIEGGAEMFKSLKETCFNRPPERRARLHRLGRPELPARYVPPLLLIPHKALQGVLVRSHTRLLSIRGPLKCVHWGKKDH